MRSLPARARPDDSAIGPWVRKALRSDALTVFVVPARSDASWGRALREAGAQLRFFSRTVLFAGLDGKMHKPLGGTMVAIVFPPRGRQKQTR